MRPLNQMMSFAATACLALMFIAPARGATADPRAYSGMKMVLQIDQEARYAQSLEGGGMRAEVVTEKAGKKHIGNVHVDPIRAKIGVTDFTTFIGNDLGDSTQLHRANGSIYTCDMNGKVMSQRDFMNAILTKVDFPALDTASKDAAALDIVLEPETTRDHAGGGAAPPPTGGYAAKSTADRLLLNHFTIDLPGIDAKRVLKVDPITVSRKVSENPVGEMRDYQKVPANWEVSNIVLTVPQQYANDFVRWHDDFVIKGMCDEGHEKTMTINVMDQAGAPQMTLTLSNVGIIAVTPVASDSGTDPTPRMRVELYAERLAFGGGVKPAAGGAAPPEPAPAPAPAPATDAGKSAAVPTVAPAGGAPAAAATDAGAAGAAPTPAPTGTTATRKKRPAAVATAPTADPTLTPTPAPLEPVQKPLRKLPQ